MLRIKHMRKARKLTQADLAKLTGISAVCISRYECGSRKPDLLDAKRIADALGCKIDDLLGSATQ